MGRIPETVEMAHRLRLGQRWLTANPDDDRYAAQTDRYWEMEDELRDRGVYGCIWGRGCPGDVDVWCWRCATVAALRRIMAQPYHHQQEAA